MRYTKYNRAIHREKAMDQRPVYVSRFRPTKAELDEICRRGEELLLTMPIDELKKFSGPY